ncbi:PLP-dependent aminotransferase family protein [Nocardioides sp.]|uniref:MocR-like transcription factor YczR n=1 Tax=Nocardioides sp. TaxID=35761 RepID=UPI00273763B1|nr:PLP-dependent aminotransferase family protein [Nocardioides sp.]MDP3891343.1 PLP-dependent aminotransferase family protein [Nocardioides sp.]
MSPAISASRVASLVGDFDRSPAYAGLADSLRLLIGDGRIALDTRLPSERELTEALGLSRTTVARAYADLRDRGFAESRRGAGSFARIPGGARSVLDRTLTPRTGDPHLIDLNCAAASAPPGVAAAYDAALAALPAYLSGHGYYPAGVPELQQAIAATYEARGLATTPDQILVTPGALSAAAIVALGLTSAGDRVVVENPVYPNATEALAHHGARLVAAPVDPGGWDLEAIGAVVRQAAPRLAYLIPDFQNPTGHLMSEAQREEYAAMLGRSRTIAVVDEAHQALGLEGQRMPPPFAALGRDTITIGSASKTFWGGLRLGWIRAPERHLAALMRARLSIDLGAPVLEQLVLTRLLEEPDATLAAQRARLRTQRDALVTALRTSLPDWSFQTPGGGLALWCHLPRPLASATAAEAERRGVIVSPGHVFAVDGGHEHFVRIPWTRPAEELEQAALVLAEAWQAAVASPRQASRSRITVA